MNELTAQTYIVILPNYFGKGASVAEAYSNARKAGFHRKTSKKMPATLVVLDAAPEDVTVYGDVGVRIAGPKGATMMELEISL